MTGGGGLSSGLDEGGKKRERERDREREREREERERERKVHRGKETSSPKNRFERRGEEGEIGIRAPLGGTL